jgi:hypothetical protein
MSDSAADMIRKARTQLDSQPQRFPTSYGDPVGDEAAMQPETFVNPLVQKALGNIPTMQKHVMKAKGGGVDAALNIARNAKAGHTGPLVSAIGGRTDHIPLDVPAGAYVLPADHVSALGEGNTLNGLKVLDHMFKTKAAAKQEKKKFANGGNVPIIAAGGEYVVSPEQVQQIGGGDMDHGHAILDNWVKQTRKDHISTLKNLPGPER